MLKIAPSILSADFGRLADEVRAVEAAGADLIHVDVMDGHFVPNITAGPVMVAGIRKATRLPLDTHLMIDHPEKFVGAFAQAGSDSITVHAEACADLHGILRQIRSLGVKAAVAVNPATPIDSILKVLAEVDMILVMTVNPGFGSQQMIPECLSKITALREILKKQGLKVPIEVDGGVNLDNIGACARAGAEVIVSGSAIFGSGDYRKTIEAMKRAIA